MFASTTWAFLIGCVFTVGFIGFFGICVFIRLWIEAHKAAHAVEGFKSSLAKVKQNMSTTKIKPRVKKKVSSDDT